MTIQINGTSGISGVDGSAGTPALQGSDSNTGISFGTDTVNINTGGTTRATVDSGGRVLVGTSSAPTFVGGQPKLNVTVGDEFGASISRWSANSYGPVLFFGKSRSATVGAYTSISNGDVLGQLYFTGADGTGMIGAAEIYCAVDGTPGTNDMPGRIVFSTTADGASSPTERMRITNSGAIIFPAGSGGPTFANADLAIYNDQGYGNGIRFGNTYGGGKSYCTFTTNGTTVGNISANGTTGTTYATTSDYRLKENVAPVANGIARLQQLKPSRFNFIADPNRIVDGFLAHEVQTVVPEAITGEKDAVDDEGSPIYQGIDQSKLVPLLTAALQEAIAKIESLETRLTALEGGTAQ